jgi:transcriptional regulator with GAF, ATPase, and Fis domain
MALERAGWRVAGEGGAAALLGISPSTFKSRMKSLDIRRSAR